jgi:hypothetical protein
MNNTQELHIGLVYIYYSMQNLNEQQLDIVLEAIINNPQNFEE